MRGVNVPMQITMDVVMTSILCAMPMANHWSAARLGLIVRQVRFRKFSPAVTQTVAFHGTNAANHNAPLTKTVLSIACVNVVFVCLVIATEISNRCAVSTV